MVLISFIHHSTALRRLIAALFSAATVRICPYSLLGSQAVFLYDNTTCIAGSHFFEEILSIRDLFSKGVINTKKNEKRVRKYVSLCCIQYEILFFCICSQADEAAKKNNCCFGTVDTWLLYRLTKGECYGCS